jgi:hypothetical protein
MAHALVVVAALGSRGWRKVGVRQGRIWLVHDAFVGCFILRGFDCVRCPAATSAQRAS